MENEVSRQRRWQVKKVALGLCQICGKTLSMYKSLCDNCHKKHKEKQDVKPTTRTNKKK